MEIIGYILGVIILVGEILMLLAWFAIICAYWKVWVSSDKEEKGSIDTHDGWEDGTWYGAASN